MKEAALKGILKARAAVNRELGYLNSAKYQEEPVEDAVKHARSALAHADSILQAEEQYLESLLLTKKQVSNDVSEQEG